MNALPDNNCAGLRFHLWIEQICKTLFADPRPPRSTRSCSNCSNWRRARTTSCRREASPPTTCDARQSVPRRVSNGVVLGHKYSEMRLDNLAGAGDAIRELAG